MHYESVISVHTRIGFSALATFWTAVLSRKGSSLHRAAGKVYFVCMAAILLSVLKKNPGPRWHLAQHMNGVAVNFAATHGSFFRFGLAAFLPIPDSPELNTVAQTSMILLALVLRLWLGKIYLKQKITRLHHEPAYRPHRPDR